MKLSRYAAPGAIVAAGAAVRFAGVGQQSYWYDESFTVHLVHGSFGALLKGVSRTESTPPLYYVLAWVWARVFGEGEAGLRSLSVLLGAALVLVAYLVARRLGGNVAGIAAAALVAVNPLLVWYSQEARAYSLAALLALLTVLALVLAHQRRGVMALTAWGVCGVAAFASHYFTVFLIVPEAIWLLLGRSGRRRPAALAVGALALGGLALLPLALLQRSRSAFLAVGTDDLVHRAGAIPKQFLLGGSAAQIDAPWIVGLAAILAGGAILGVALTARRNARSRAVVALGALAIALPLVLALAGADYVNPRNVLPALPVLLIGVGLACGTWRLWGRVAYASAAGLVVLFLAVDVAVTRSPRLQRDDWRGAARIIAADSPAPTAIALTPAGSESPLSVYLPTLHPVAPDYSGVRAVWALSLTRPPGAVPATSPGALLRPARTVSTPSFIARRYDVPTGSRVSARAIVSAIFRGVPASVAVR